MLLKFAAAAAALALSCAVATAEDAKPNDAQIAHIAYTADQIDIKAAQLALQKSSQRYLKFQDGGASRCVGYPRMVETRRVWRSE